MKKLFTFILCIPLFIFSAETGKLTGKITSAVNGEPLIGVNVLIDGTDMGAATNENGEFVILNIPAAQYTVTFSYIGHKSVTMKNVFVNADLNRQLDVNLEESSVEGETVIVTAKRDIIIKDQTASATTIVSEDINNMPVNSYTEVLTNLVGVVENSNGGGDDGIHIRGGRSGEIAYMVDGIMVKDAMFGGMGSDVTRDGISELSVTIGSFNAEYGHAMSGIVNIVTKEGSSDYEWNARTITDQFGGYQNNWNSSRFEGTLSGPLLQTNPGFGNFLLTGDIYSTDTHLKNNFLPKNIYTPGNDGILFTDDDPFAVANIDNDSDLETMKKGARMIFNTYKDESRLLAKLSLRPLENLKVTLGKNLSFRESRGYSNMYRLFSENSEINWMESDLRYVNASLSISKDMFINVKWSKFTNENWSGHPSYLNDQHELYSKIFTIPDNWDYALHEPNDEFVWLSNFAEPYNDISQDGSWGYAAEYWIDDNGNGKWDEGEYFSDSPVMNGTWDAAYTDEYGYLIPAEEWEDLDSNGVWNQGEPFTDLEYYNGIWDIYAVDTLTGNPIIEQYADLNGDGQYNVGMYLAQPASDAYDGLSNYEYYDTSVLYNNFSDSVGIVEPIEETYTHYIDETEVLQGSLTWQVNPVHQIKTGFEMKDYYLRYFGFFNMGGGVYGGANYDAFEMWDANPVTRSFYFQNKMEYDDLVINLGIRWDQLTPNSKYADPTKSLAYYLEGEFVEPNTEGADWGYFDVLEDTILFVSPENASIKEKWSPRIGIGYPVTDRTAFHFSYGQFYQYPEFVYMYWYANTNGYSALPPSMNNLQSYVNSSNTGQNVFGNSMYPFPYNLGDWYIPTVGSPNLKPETTIAYEFGLRTRLSNDYVLSTTIFYKDMYDYIASTIYDADPTEYAIFENHDYANSRGFEISLRKLFSQNLSWTVNYTFTRAEGNAENEFAHWNEAYLASVYGTFPARKTVIMPWDQPHTFNVNITYAHPLGFGLNMVGNMGSGLPYTPTDSRGRQLDEKNSGRMPATSVFDLKMYFDFQYAGLNCRIFSDVENVFNSKNILNVFNDSGKVDESLDPGTSQVDEYRPQWYGKPRHIEIGIEFGMGG